MKNILKSRLFTFILGGIIFGSITGVVAYTINASNVEYKPSWTKENGDSINNVKEAVDELYNKSNNTKTKQFTLNCNSYENNLINCNIKGTTDMKTIKIKNVLYDSASFTVGYYSHTDNNEGGSDGIRFNSINPGDIYNIDGDPRTFIEFYGSSTKKYGNITIFLEVEYYN